MNDLYLSSDWHPDWTTLGKPRYEEIEKLAFHTVTMAVAAKADLYGFLGDLCDPDRGPVVLRCARLAIRCATELSRAGIPSFWLDGNHDVFEDGSGDSSLTPLRGLRDKLVRVISAPETISYSTSSGDVHVHGFPFTAPSHSYDPLQHPCFTTKLLHGKHIVVSHLHLRGILPGDETTQMPRGRSVELPRQELRDHFAKSNMPLRIFNGHYHRAQNYDGVHVVGSLARLTFSEQDHVPSYSVVRI